MKDADWLSDFPAAWQDLRADFLCDPYRVTVSPDQYEGEMVAHYSIPQVQETGGPLVEPADDIDSTKLLITSSTLLVSKLNPRKKTICIAEPQGDLVTLASSEFIPIRSDQFDQRYAFYVWQSEKVTDRLSAIVQSATRSHQRVLPADILKLPWKWPPAETQRRIAAFLDEKTAQIDGLIARKHALLERLAEKRQAIITQVVTKGLNPAAPMKDSGIDWLGEIPTHWEVKRLDHLNDDRRPICYGIVLPGPHFEGGVPIIKGGDVRPERLKRELLNCTDPEIDAANPRARVAAGDLVYTIRGSFGDVELVPNELIGCNLTQDAARISPVVEVDRRWLLMALKSSVVRGSLAAGSVGATIKGINIFDLRRALLPTPPAQEQREIADSLMDATTYLDGIQRRVESSLSGLTEYRAALITAAVTGQIEGLQ